MHTNKNKQMHIYTPKEQTNAHTYTPLSLSLSLSIYLSIDLLFRRLNHIIPKRIGQQSGTEIDMDLRHSKYPSKSVSFASALGFRQSHFCQFWTLDGVLEALWTGNVDKVSHKSEKVP